MHPYFVCQRLLRLPRECNRTKKFTMLQRIQSVYLLLAIACMSALLLLPLIQLDSPTFNENIAGWDVRITFEGLIWFVFAILCSTAIGVSLLNIFLFKWRGLQMFLCVVALLFLASAEGFCYYRYQTKVFPGDVVFTFWNLLAIVSALLLILAFVSIRKDDALVKSLDRLRD